MTLAQQNSEKSKLRVLHTPSSSALEYVEHYDDDYLTVKFRNGGLYTYTNVSRAKFSKLCSAESIGQYYVKNIKGQYNCIGPRNLALENKVNDMLSAVEILPAKKESKKSRR